MNPLRLLAIVVASLLLMPSPARGGDLQYKERLLDLLATRVPGILASFDAQTGRFGSGIWTCQDQHPMYPLAVAYATPGKGNRYYQDPKLLEVIVKSGGPLLENMDARGQWVFAKKDGSTWGNIWMPWTYSRWIRTFALIRDRMPPESRAAWTDALALGYSGIGKHELGHIHNIPAHHAMGLYIAGRTLDRSEWCTQAADFLAKVAASQSPGGYWSEGEGPVVVYNFVYVDALGTFYALSRDERVLPALERAAAFHRRFTYPNGSNIETIDQRNPYHETVAQGNVGFTFTPAGRSYLENQWTQSGWERLDPDLIASLLLYGAEGPLEPAGQSEGTFVLKEGGADRAATIRRGPWFLCLSAYTAPVSTSRWIQDRQNMASIYHDRVGLIAGGGNTKLQPAWSSFTVGDTALLAHAAGDTNPTFTPKGPLFHVPQAAELLDGDPPGLKLTCGPETCFIRLRIQDRETLEYEVETTAAGELPVIAHLTLLPDLDAPLQTAAGSSRATGAESWALSPDQIAGYFTYRGCRWELPVDASLHWPALPHNPYRIDGRADPAEGRLEIRIPLNPNHPRQTITLRLVP